MSNAIEQALAKAEFPVKFQSLFKPARYKVYYGGRGGAKSWCFARALLLMGGRRAIRVLCAREYQNSISQCMVLAQLVLVHMGSPINIFQEQSDRIYLYDCQQHFFQQDQ